MTSPYPWPHLTPHYRETLALGLPLIVAQLGQIVLGMVDSAMIGQYAMLDLSAASFCINLFNLPIFFALGFGYALTPRIGQRYARGELLDAAATLRYGLIINVLLGLLLTLIMGALYWCIPYFGQPVELLGRIQAYYLTVVVALTFITAFNALKQFTDALGDTKVSMWIMLAGNVGNIFLNWLLIFGHWGFPALGLLGAGIATAAMRLLMPVVLLVYIVSAPRYRRYRKGFLAPQLPRGEMGRLTSIGTFIGLQMALENGLFALSIIIVGWLGSVPLAAHHIAVTVQSIGFMIFYGAGAAIAIRVSHFWGLHQYGNARRAAFGGLHVVFLLAAIVMLLLFLCRDHIPWIFTDNPHVAALVTSLLLVGLLYQPADALQVTMANAARGLGESKSLMLISFIGYFLIALPLAYCLGIRTPLATVGVWLAYPVGLGLAGLGFLCRFHYVLHQKYKLHPNAIQTE